MKRLRVGILGATGLVGQRLVDRLVGHPWFAIARLAASERSIGRRYAEAATWRLTAPVPEPLRDREVVACDPASLADCDIVFSALARPAAEAIEPAFAAAGFAVVSNSAVFRQAPDVPLVVPEINPGHLELIDVQRRRTGGGFIVTNPNCSVTGLALALAPLHEAFGVRRVVVTTLQALSGAGARGPYAMDLTDNVLPWIRGEEEKMQPELDKILGRCGAEAVAPAGVVLSAHCHRVGTLDGHLEAVSVELAEAEVSVERAAEAIRGWRGAIAGLELPTAPARPVELRDEPDRPQPRLDRDAGGGMTVVVGRLRPCPVLGLRLEVLSHNAIRGAAGGTLLNAELLVARDRIPRRDRA